MSELKLRSLCIASVLLISPAALAQAQQSAPASPPPQSASAQQDETLSAAQLDALVAPIALYPDTLLSQVLMASTYPLGVIEADRWVKANKSLKGDTLKSAAEQQKWDDSVKSLTATPSVLEMMSTQLKWMQQLGDAVLAQQPDVMDAVQRLRTKAEANGKLASTKQQKVSSKTQGSKKVIVIEPAEPETIYVPYYDPAVVYGAWPYPAYPPYYWPAPGYIAGGIIATGLAFGAGYALGRWASGGGYWGGGNTINWSNNNINVGGGNRNWVHNPIHRGGIRYNNGNVADRFGGNRAGVSDRMDFRGRGGQQVLRPDAGGRPGGGIADRPGGARPGGGAERPGGRPGGGPGQGIADRPGGGPGANRPSQRPAGGGGRRDNALGNIGSGGGARAEALRGRASAGGLGGGGGRLGAGGGGGGRSFGGGGGGGGRSFGGGGGGRGGGGGGGRGGGGGGRRSDMRLKHDVAFLGQLDNGLGFYKFAYDGGSRVYVGVMAQEVQSLAPHAVVRGSDGLLRVRYERLGLQFGTYDDWVKSGAKLPAAAPLQHRHAAHEE